MDTQSESLTSEDLEAARRFRDLLSRRMDVSAVYWLRSDEESSWYLNVASTDIGHAPSAGDYSKVLDAAEEADDPNLNPALVTLVGLDDPIARGLIEFQKSHPAPLATRMRRRILNNRWIEDLYLYPPLQRSGESKAVVK